jgi:hypothetical protein
MQMTSGQPKIIENEKGLLIDFQLVGTQVNKTSVSPSLTVNLGNLYPQSATTVKWIMTASLSGTK